MYNESFTAFSNEQEVILQEGLKFKIVNKEIKTHLNWEYYEVHLEYNDDL